MFHLLLVDYWLIKRYVILLTFVWFSGEEGWQQMVLAFRGGVGACTHRCHIMEAGKAWHISGCAREAVGRQSVPPI